MRTWATNEQCTIIKMGSVYSKEHKTYHMHHKIEIKTVQGKTGFSKFYLKDWSLEDYSKIGVLEFI